MSNDKPKEIKINVPPNVQGGNYANNMLVTYTKEEFIMDFMMIVPPVGVVNSRVIINPGHLKRIIKALEDNVKKYESNFGVIEIAEEPKGEIGFTH